jgi:protein TonB
MFADALLDSHRLGHSRRGWATLTSFGMQVIGIACLVILPLFYTQVLPLMRTTSETPIAAPPTEATPIALVQPHGDTVSANPRNVAILHMPIRIPITIAQDSGQPLEDPFSGIGQVHGNTTEAADPTSGVLSGIGTKPVPVLAEPSKPRVVRVSAMMEGSLLHRVEPIYPPIARSAGIQGSVVIAAVIGRDGSVEKLQVLSGHPMLIKPAIDAVSQWRYRPYILNDAPIEVDTHITVNFILAR